MKIKQIVLDFWNTHITTILLIVMLLAFVGSSAFFATHLKRAIVPDEPAHFVKSEQFSTTWGIPPIVPGYIALGFINHRPFLYYWINGRILDILIWVFPAISDWQKLVSLRLISVFYSLLSIIFCYLLAKEIIKSRWWSLLVVFLMTNTLMFVFLSGGVNYDNLTNLCSFSGIYFLIRVFNSKPFYQNSLGWLICICIGTLVKITELPLAAITGLVWILYIVKHRRQINFWPSWNWKLVGLITVFIALVSLNFSIWGVNLVKYKHLTPGCSQVLTEAQCNLSPFVARAQIFNLPKKLSYIDIINNKGPNPVQYILDYWTNSMIWRVFGILGHKNYIPPALILTFYRLLLIWAIFITIRHWKKPSFTIGSLCAIMIFYTIVLLGTNYNSELITGFKHLTIQGRYIFPVVGIIYVLIVYYFASIGNTILRRLTVGSTLLLFLIGCPVLFLLYYSSIFTGWFY